MTTHDAVETETTRIWIDDNGLMHLKVFPGAKIDLDDMKATVKAQLEITGNRPAPILADMRDMHSSTRAAREYVAAESPRTGTAIAMLVGAPLSKVMGNLFMTFNKPLVPTRMFTREDEALAWLKRFL